MWPAVVSDEPIVRRACSGHVVQIEEWGVACVHGSANTEEVQHTYLTVP